MRLWLIGTRTDAERAFPLIIAKLREQNIADYVPNAEQDHVLAVKRRKQEAIESRKGKIRLAVLLIIWLAFGAAGGWAASRYGWLAGVGGAVFGVVLYPFALFGFLVVRWELLSWSAQKKKPFG